MASIMDGSQPLERAQNSGGIGSILAETGKDAKWGLPVNITGFGGIVSKHAEWTMGDYFRDISDPLNTHLPALNTSFNEFFRWMKQNRKEDKGGLFKTLYEFAPHFFDFKVWKKITGQARKPEIAALHQIRDILLKTVGKDLSASDKITLGRDPKDIFDILMDSAPSLMRKYSGDDKAVDGLGNILKNLPKAMLKFTRETITESEIEDLRFGALTGRMDAKGIGKKRRDVSSGGLGVIDKVGSLFDKGFGFGARKDTAKYFGQSDWMSKEFSGLSATTKGQLKVAVVDDTSQTAKSLEKQVETSKKQLALEKKIDKREEFQERIAGWDNDGGKKKFSLGSIGGILKKLGIWALLSGLAFKLFGKEGLIATAAAGFFLNTMPFLLKKGLGMLGEGAGKLVRKGGSSIMGGVRGLAGGKAAGKSPMILRMLKNPSAALRMLRVGATKGGATAAKGAGAAGTAAGAVAGGAAFLGLTLHDILQQGGARDEWKQGKKGKAVAGGFFGKDLTEGGGKEVAGNIFKQTSKYAGLGAAIGAPTGIGIPIGAAIGAAVGLVGSSIKVMWEKGILQYFGKMVKHNKIGLLMGGFLGSILMPGPGTVLGFILGPFLQNKIKKGIQDGSFQRIFKMIASRAGSAFKKIGTTVASAAQQISGKVQDIFAGYTNLLKNNIGGAITGGVLLTAPLSAMFGPLGGILATFIGAKAQDKIKNLTLFQKIGDIAGAFGERLAEVGSNLKDLDFEKAFSSIKLALKDAMKSLSGAFLGAIEEIKSRGLEFLKNFWDNETTVVGPMPQNSTGSSSTSSSGKAYVSPTGTKLSAFNRHYKDLAHTKRGGSDFSYAVIDKYRDTLNYLENKENLDATEKGHLERLRKTIDDYNEWQRELEKKERAKLAALKAQEMMIDGINGVADIIKSKKWTTLNPTNSSTLEAAEGA